MQGIVYLIHFESKLHRAQHYLGWTVNLENRLHDHRTGNGSHLMAAVVKAGINFSVVRTWKGARKKERALKNRKKARLFCPTCITIQKGGE